jgi:hypothetical protein
MMVLASSIRFDDTFTRCIVPYWRSSYVFPVGTSYLINFQYHHFVLSTTVAAPSWQSLPVLGTIAGDIPVYHDNDDDETTLVKPHNLDTNMPSLAQYYFNKVFIHSLWDFLAWLWIQSKVICCARLGSFAWLNWRFMFLSLQEHQRVMSVCDAIQAGSTLSQIERVCSIDPSGFSAMIWNGSQLYKSGQSKAPKFQKITTILVHF